MWVGAGSYEIRSIGGSLQSASMSSEPCHLQGLRHPRHHADHAERGRRRGLGLAFGSAALALGERVVAVGRDGRLSGPALAAALMRGLVAAGVEVIDIGLATTPMLYFAASTLCTSGIQVTGSHNPRDDNGFKMVLAGRAIYGDDIQACAA
jgi:phosphomannomutase